MRVLERERAVLRRSLPGLDEALAAIPMAELERPGSPGIKAFREAGGPALLVPADLGGVGGSALDALRVQRAIGSRSASLAVATTMHHFSVASLVAVSENNADGVDWMLLGAIAEQRLLLASGFAEGRADGRILRPTMTATPTAGGIRLSGLKRPCSLARSMDLLTASVMLPRPDGSGDQLAVALIPAREKGVSVAPFWSGFALAGAESEQVTIDDVLVPPELVVRTDVTDDGQLDDIQNAGFLWFELLMIGSYLGAASALVERVMNADRVADSERLRLMVPVEAAMAGAENIARRMAGGGPDGRRLLADALLVRYAAQDAIAAVVPQAVELIGGLAFMSSDDVGYLAAAVNGLAFHPPARARMAGPLVDYFAGKPLEIV